MVNLLCSRNISKYVRGREIEKDLFEKCLGFPYVMGDDQSLEKKRVLIVTPFFSFIPRNTHTHTHTR
jgi:hypothetical protein